MSDYKCLCCSVAKSCPTLILWTAAHQASPSFTVSQSLLRFTSLESVVLCNHLILCCPLVLWPSGFPSIRVFSFESALRIRWPKYWNFSFSISPSNEYSGLISFRIDWLIDWSVLKCPDSKNFSKKLPLAWNLALDYFKDAQTLS